MPNFRSLALNELRQSSISLLLRVAGWLGGRVAGWVAGRPGGWVACLKLEIRLTSALVGVEVELRLSLAIMQKS